MNNDDLTELWTSQVRQKVEQYYGGVEERTAERTQRLVDAGLMPPVPPEEVAHQRQERIAQTIAEQLPFALKIGRESGTAGPLTEEQLSDVWLLATQQHTHDLLQQFEERLQNATPTMNPQRRQFAEALLTMSKQHTELMDERLVGNDSVTEGDLSDVADRVAGDLDTLTQGLIQQFEDRLQNDATMPPERRQFGEAYLPLLKQKRALQDEVTSGKLSEAEAANARMDISRQMHQLVRTLYPPPQSDDDASES